MGPSYMLFYSSFMNSPNKDKKPGLDALYPILDPNFRYSFVIASILFQIKSFSYPIYQVFASFQYTTNVIWGHKVQQNRDEEYCAVGSSGDMTSF